MSFRSTRKATLAISLGAIAILGAALVPRSAAAREGDEPNRAAQERQAPTDEPRASRTEAERLDLAERLGEARGTVEVLEIELAHQKQLLGQRLQSIEMMNRMTLERRGMGWLGGRGGMGGGFRSLPKREATPADEKENEKEQSTASGEARKQLEELKKDFDRANVKYLELSRKLGRERQRLSELDVALHGRRRAASDGTSDLNRRLGEIERKLDVLLNAGDRPGR